jgi:hypothetical protein
MTRRRAGQRRNRCTRISCRSTTSITHRRRQFSTFCKHKVVENNYGCLQNASESNSSGRGADSDDEENREGIDGEEEEEENPLPATQASRTGWVMTRRTGQRRNQCTRTSCRSMTSITHRRRQFTTFYNQKVVENHYGCLQNVVRKQFLGLRSGQQRRGEPRGDRGGGKRGRKLSSSDSGKRGGKFR